MPKKKLRTRLRFTPGPPTREALKRYPLWCAALDEEGKPGQDESTVRPSDDQTRIDWTTAHAAAVAITGNGRRFEAMISSGGFGMTATSEIEQATIWIGAKRVTVKLLTGVKVWMHESEQSPIGYFTDAYLPLEIRTVALAARGKEPLVITLMADGTLRFEAPPEPRPVLPTVLRVTELRSGDRSILERSGGYVGIDVSQPGEPVIMRSAFEIRREGNVFVERETIDQVDPGFHHRIESSFDASTLRPLSVTKRINGHLKDSARAGARGRNGLPNDCFYDVSTVLRLVSLELGWTRRIPLYELRNRQRQHAVVTVEALEPAPRQPGSRAWRVDVNRSPTTRMTYWYDVETMDLLAFETHARFSARHTLFVPPAVLEAK